MLRSWATLLAVAYLLLPSSAHCELLFDFEGPYLVDPGHTIKDHEMIYDGQAWHCIYIRGLEGVGGTISETELGHATTVDLQTWSVGYPVLTAGPDSWDSRNVWAPTIFPTPANPSQWTMLYTGTDATVVQRMGRAFTTAGTLDRFYKFATNPILEPDSTTYDWAPGQWFSSFRDPFYFYRDGVHHVLHTVGLDGAQRRGAVHHATSLDLVNWIDAGVLAVNNNDALGTQWHDIESVQLIEHGGEFFLFFTEQNVEGVRWVRSAQYDSGWDISAAQVLDPEGIAAEVTPITNDDFLFTRHIPYLHATSSPDSGLISWTLRADTLRFHPTSGDPYLVSTDPLAGWPVRTGSAFISAPTFGDNARERGVGSAGLHGNGYLSTRDFFSGPASGFGSPGGDLGTGATGTIQSPNFVIPPGTVSMSLLVGGGTSLDCFVALVRASDDSTLFSARGHGSDRMRPVVWNTSGLEGTACYLRVEDNSTASNGWITIDEVRLNPSAVAAPPSARKPAGRLLPNHPNPFNPRTVLNFEIPRRARVELVVLDLRGRRITRLRPGTLEAGTHSTRWDGRDDAGRAVGSGVYFVQLRVDGDATDARKITLVR